MLRKASFLLITVFWVIMNALLWREEFSSKSDLGAETPAGLVWEKILTSPDDSGLAVQFGKDRVGYVRWIPNIGEEEATGKTANENSEIEGRIKRLTGYTIHADGNFILPEERGRFRFDFHASFDAEHGWISWQLKSLQRPSSFSIAANRKTQMFEFSLGEEPEAVRQSFRFADLRNSEKLLAELGAAGSLPFAAGLIPPMAANSTNSLAIGLRWEARQDWLKMGHSRV